MGRPYDSDSSEVTDGVVEVVVFAEHYHRRLKRRADLTRNRSNTSFDTVESSSYHPVIRTLGLETGVVIDKTKYDFPSPVLTCRG